MDAESVVRQVSDSSPAPLKSTSFGSLATVFKYVVIGTGILGVGFLIAIGGFLFLR